MGAYAGRVANQNGTGSGLPTGSIYAVYVYGTPIFGV
jgi:hypothetical protein